MTSQIALKLPDDMLAAVDQLVAQEYFGSRSEAVRAGLELVIGAAQRRSIDDAFTAGFARHPETPSEMRRATHLAVAAIDDEPWERWW